MFVERVWEIIVILISDIDSFCVIAFCVLVPRSE